MHYSPNFNDDRKKIDLLENYSDTHSHGIPYPKKRKFFWGTSFMFYPFLIIGLLFVIGIVRSIAHSESTSQTLANIPIFSHIKKLVLADNKPTQPADDRVNILLLGIGGEQHDGGYLTDTIIIASLKKSTHQVALVSIPRDMLVPLPDKTWRKINSVHALEYLQNSDGALERSTKTISQLLNLPLHYSARIDFSGFEKAIDAVGGIDVMVDRSFTDSTYPIDDGRGNITTVSFTAGKHHMNGKEALVFARSRHGTNGEGSDFARAARQQKIIMAFKDELFSFSTLFSGKRISKLISITEDHFESTLSLSDSADLAGKFKDVPKENIVTRVIDASPNGFLLNDVTPDGAFVLVPKNYDFHPIQSYLAHIFDPMEREQEYARITVQNSTTIEGLATITKQELEANNFTVARVENASLRDLDKTIIYDLSSGKNPKTISDLATFLNAQLSPVIPEPLRTIQDADIVVVLGHDRAGSVAGERAQ
ncbi:MAG: Cell envelope-related transcriptional attenuator [Parcubacteria group bacterium GW2011_GWA2_43_13]|nr:MAG: Cell envelope-related transcriptional attenuator [Parcubacteria group bacterium GW2011_GWA2_43_13]HAZ16310.1 hypothetical protein [Candidatus Jacksonbacteria bacterium]